VNDQRTNEKGMVACPAPDPNPKRPGLLLPAGACDCHAHVFDGARFAYQANRGYTPPDNPVTRLLALHDVLGIARGVVVQASVHGIDNAAVLHRRTQAGCARWPQSPRR
jgi:predicted TIM-barrel fold metal-dependent hydrolase